MCALGLLARVSGEGLGAEMNGDPLEGLILVEPDQDDDRAHRPAWLVRDGVCVAHGSYAACEAATVLFGEPFRRMTPRVFMDIFLKRGCT